MPPASLEPRADDGGIQRQVLPEIPRSALGTIAGTVRIRVRVLVDASGAVTEARSLSPDASPFFVRRVLQAAEQWQFAPAPPDRGDAAREWVLRFELRPETVAVVVASP
jgi:TonB family protein